MATPIRVADPGAARLLTPGDIVDVLATLEAGFEGRLAPAETVADDVTVISTPPSKPETGALIVLATTSEQAARLAAAQTGGHLSVTIAPRG